MAATTKSGFGRAKLRGARDHPAPVTATVKGQAHMQAQAFRIAGVQMASGPNVAANLNEAGRLIEAAVAQGARLVALPEYFAIMGMRPTDKVKIREKDVDIIVVPSAFTETTGRAHWESLVRARAIENLAYVLAPAQGGYHLGQSRLPGQPAQEPAGADPQGDP
jgi:predicted amidohydrolase